MRAVRATVVVPGLFALTDKVIGNPQMVLFAVFGGFASLVLASFGGGRRDKAIAHLGLAVVGSAALAIGTAVSGTTWLAALVTIPVAFGIFFAGVAGPNAASGVTAALLIYVLPVASAGPASTIPDRLAGWWLACAVSTAAVLLLSPRPPGDRLRAAAAASANALAAQLDARLRGVPEPGGEPACVVAKHKLIATFSATPYRPTGLATADQALANVVQLLEWCTGLVADALDGHLGLGRPGLGLGRPGLDPGQAAPADRDLLAVAAGLLRDAAALLSGRDAAPDIAGMERASEASSAAGRHARHGDTVAAKQAFHAQSIAVAARGVAEDALIITGRATPEVIAAQRRAWFGGRPDDGPAPSRRFGALAGAAGVVGRHASFRSVWVLNGLRGALALAAAVAVADISGVQHGFWVVLGTLSVLRTNAASTGSTAVRALLGTVAGFVIGAALLVGIGTGPAGLWVALPVAVLVAAYSPGTMPFTVGQAAFTITVVVLFNLLAPAGWTVGLLRVQDVAIGCAVSLVVGVLFWPRGAGSVVGDDLADAYRRGGAYLTQAVEWALGLRGMAPDIADAAVTAGIRLDDALRAYLAEQGSKRVSKEDLWMLVMSTMRLRLTAHSLAMLRDRGGSAYRDAPAHVDEARAALRRRAAELTGFYDSIAAQVGRPDHGHPPLAAVPPPGEPAMAEVTAGGSRHHHPQTLWVREYLHHLGQHAAAVPGPALRVAQQRRIPWWR
jgi:uncharacterized membrane protein YccC